VRGFRALPAASAVAVLSILGAPAGASPKNVKIDAVFRSADCAGSTCEPSKDPKLSGGAVVAGEIQVFASAAADIGLEWVRLEGREGGTPQWYCLQYWATNRATTFGDHYAWTTTNWPQPAAQGKNSDCTETSPHKHGAPADNGVYDIRLVAREQVSKELRNSDPFTIKIANPPQPPAWGVDPKASGAADGNPAVTLVWNASATPDVSEYHFVRVDPGGFQSEFAVSASTPQDQGCSKVGDQTFKCVDVSFPGSAFGGAYRYTLLALRPTPGKGVACSIGGGACLESPLTAVKEVVLTDPQGAASTDESGTAGGKGRGTGAGNATKPAPVEQATDRSEQIAAAALDVEPGTGPGALPKAVAAVLVLLASGAAGFVYWKRRPAA